jgi:hypothetical protein
MSRPTKSAAVVLIIAAASAIYMQDNNGYAEKLAMASETPASIPVQSITNPGKYRLRQLSLQRKHLLEHLAQMIELNVKAGRATKSEYVQAKRAALLAGIDLCNTGSERVEIYREIVKLYLELEEDEKRKHEAGINDRLKISKLRIVRVEAEIDLLREQLK